MARKSVQTSIGKRSAAWAWALIKRNPITSIAAIVGIFAGIPGAVAGYNYGLDLIEPAAPALHHWVRAHVAEVTSPIVTVQKEQAVAIDRFLLYRSKQDLKDLQSDPALKSSPKLKEDESELQQQIDETKARIKKATGK